MSAAKGASGGSMRIVNLQELLDKLDSNNKKVEKAVKRTVTDFKSRGNAWVAAGVVKHYNIKKADIKAAITGKKSSGSIKISGIMIDNIGIEYSGRPLSPTHFKMRPTKIPLRRQSEYSRIPGVKVGEGSDVAMMQQPKPYTITAEIKKGSRVSFPEGTFLGGTGGDKYIPYQRKGSKRTPIEAIKTVSIPQMITNEEAGEDIVKNVNEGIEKRLHHHLDRELSK